MMNCNTWRYITFIAGQNRDWVRNLGQFGIPGDIEILRGQAANIWDCPGKFGMDGHLRIDVSKDIRSFGLFQQDGQVRDQLRW